MRCYCHINPTCDWCLSKGQQMTHKSPQEISTEIVQEVIAKDPDFGWELRITRLEQLIAQAIEAERTSFEETLAIKLNEIGADNSNCYDLDDLFSLMKSHFEISVEAERERAKILEDALEFYADKGNWDETYHEWDDENQGDVGDRIDHDDVETEDDGEGNQILTVAGKRAREALLKFRGGV